MSSVYLLSRAGKDYKELEFVPLRRAGQAGKRQAVFRVGQRVVIRDPLAYTRDEWADPL
jgi:hypothetical protein